MKDKGHFITSIIKSGIRIASCVYLILTWNFIWFAFGFGVAELLGVVEELLDDR